MDKMEVYELETGDKVNEGDVIIDFRGDKWVFVAVVGDGRSYKIDAHKPHQENSHRLFFASVFRLEIK